MRFIFPPSHSQVPSKTDERWSNKQEFSRQLSAKESVVLRLDAATPGTGGFRTCGNANNVAAHLSESTLPSTQYQRSARNFIHSWEPSHWYRRGQRKADRPGQARAILYMLSVLSPLAPPSLHHALAAVSADQCRQAAVS